MITEQSPDHCPSGHVPADNMLVGWLHFSCAGGPGHRTWVRLNCGATMYEPDHVSGCPGIYKYPDMPAGTVWAVSNEFITAVIREDVEVTADGSVYFSSDRIAVRAKMRTAWGFSHEPSIVKITLASE